MPTYVSLYLQNVLDYSPVEAGAAFLPLTVMFILVAPQAGRLADRFGSRALVASGMTLLSIMLLYYSQLGTRTSFWMLLPGLLVGGLGMGLTMTPTTAAAMTSVPIAKAGVGSAVLSSMRQVGGSVGIAVMGALVASGQSTAMRAGDPPPVAYLHGFHSAVKIAALLALAGAIVAFAAIRRPVHDPAEAAIGSTRTIQTPA